MASYIIEKKKLIGEYKEVFEKAETYGILLGVNGQVQEEMLLNLIDILYTAQQEGKPVVKIIGNDVEQFCKDYFQEQRGIREYIQGIPSGVYRVSLVILFFGILEFIYWEEEISGSIWQATMDISGFLLGGVIGVLISILALWVLQPILFKLRRVNATVISFVIVAFSIAGIVAGTILCEEESVPVPLIPIVVGGGIYAIIYKGYQLYQRYRKTGTIKKPQKDGTFREIYRETQKTETPRYLRKRFEKINRRRRKRGKTEVTRAEFTKRIQKEYKISIRAVAVLYAAVWAGSTISDALQGQLWPDTVIFAGSLAFLYLGFYQLFKPNYIMRLLKQCEKEGKDIIELAERAEE